MTRFAKDWTNTKTMKNIQPIGTIDVVPLLLQLKMHPELWDEHTWRTRHPTSPHHGLSDIWIRYRDIAEYDGDWDAFNGPHEQIWYPAADKLPAVKDIAFNLMARVRGERLGTILITKIPPGGTCKPHTDFGWACEYYQTKIAVQLESHPDQAFCFKGEQYSARPGECYYFRNTEEHWVVNESPVDRITLIVCMRTGT